jgi:hypothetical protein
MIGMLAASGAAMACGLIELVPHQAPSALLVSSPHSSLTCSSRPVRAWADAVTGVIKTDTGAWLCRT